MFKLHQPGSTLYFKSIKSFDKYLSSYNKDIKIDLIEYNKLNQAIKKPINSITFISISMRYVVYNIDNKVEYWKDVEHSVTTFDLI